MLETKYYTIVVHDEPKQKPRKRINADLVIHIIILLDIILIKLNSML